MIEPLDPETCHPECTKEYCQANPTELCSARCLHETSLNKLLRCFSLCFYIAHCIVNSNLTVVLCRFVSVEKKPCQGSCQHTSCSSCLLLNPPSCPQTCGPSDPSCLRRFGKCVHNHLTAAHSPACHNNLQVKASESHINNKLSDYIASFKCRTFML